MNNIVDTAKTAINFTGTKIVNIHVPAYKTYANPVNWYSDVKDDLRVLDRQAYLFGKYFTDNADEYNLSKPEDKKFLKTDRKFLSEIGSLMKKQNLISHASSLYTGFKAYQMGYFSIDDYEADAPFCELKHIFSTLKKSKGRKFIIGMIQDIFMSISLIILKISADLGLLM